MSLEAAIHVRESENLRDNRSVTLPVDMAGS
jgi:hypothetical protein